MNLDFWMYGVDGKFGSGKTQFLVRYMLQFANKKDTIVFSNVSMDKRKIQNYVYFDETNFFQVLQFIAYQNYLDREKFWTTTTFMGQPFTQYKREKFKKYIVCLDETGILFNNLSKPDPKYLDYLLQCRKINTRLLFCSQKIERVVKVFREYIDWIFYSKPLLDIPFIRNLKVVRQKMTEDNGAIKMEPYIWLDEQGDFITKYRPMDKYFDFFWSPFTYDYYDDWKMNLRDENPYIIAHQQRKALYIPKEYMEASDNSFWDMSETDYNVTKEQITKRVKFFWKVTVFILKGGLFR